MDMCMSVERFQQVNRTEAAAVKIDALIYA